MRQLPSKNTLIRLAVILLFVASIAARSATITDFCLGERPADGRAEYWDATCPGHLSMLAKSASSTSEVALETAKLANAKSLADLLTPLDPVGDKADVSAFAIEAQQLQGILTFQAAQAIGSNLGRYLSSCSGPGDLSPPGKPVQPGTVTLRWQPVPDADRYNIKITNLAVAPPSVSSVEVTSTEHTVSLGGNGRYAWTVAPCRSGNCGRPSASRYLTTDAAASVPEDRLHCSPEPVLLVSSTERAALIGAVRASALTANLETLTASLGKLTCEEKEKGAVKAAMADAAAVAAGLQLLSAAVTYFQPQLLASAAVAAITEPAPLLAAGVSSSLTAGPWDLRLHEPSISADNPVLKSVEGLRIALVIAASKFAACDAEAASTKAGKEVIKQIDAHLASQLKAEAGGRSVVDLAAREAALRDAGVRHTLLVSRDIGGGTSALVKPYGLAGLRVLSGAAVVLSYQLVNLDSGVPVATGCKAARWKAQTKVSKWPKPHQTEPISVNDCDLPVKPN